MSGWNSDEESGRFITPRPIHSVPRKINKHPSESEPKFGRSYDDMNDSFLDQAEQFENQRGLNFKLSSLRRKSSQSHEDIQKFGEMRNSLDKMLVRQKSMSDTDLKDRHAEKDANVALILPKKQLHFEQTKNHQETDFNPKVKEGKALSKSLKNRSSSSLSRKDAKSQARKRTKARRMKLDSFYSDVEYGHDINDNDDDFFIFDTSDMSDIVTISSSHALTEDDSTIYYSDREKDLIIGTDIQRQLDRVLNADGKKKLILKDMNLSSKDIPVNKICSEPFGHHLHKLSLSGNKLISLPEQLTVELTGLRTLDLSQCRLRALPSKWNFPNLKILNLSHNRIQEFFDLNALLGFLNLEQLDMFDNQIDSFILPEGEYLQNLVSLNLDFNNLVELPDDLPRLKSLKSLKVSNNLITNIPRFVCEMSLTELIVTPNPIIQPPIEDCERGIHGIRRYYCGLSSKDSKKPTSAKKKDRPVRRRLKKKKDKSNQVPKRITNEQEHLSEPVDSFERNISEITPESELYANSGDFSSISIHDVPSSSTRNDVEEEKMDYQESLEDQPIHLQEPNVERALNVFAVQPTKPPSPEQTVSKNIVNDTLKVIFVGNAYAGKTTIIKRLKEGRKATPPKVQERTIGVNIYEWDPGVECPMHEIATSKFDSRVMQESESTSAPVDVKFSIWDFAGQNEYLASHEIFFSSRALYVLVWDMAFANEDVMVHKKASFEVDDGPFRLDDSSSEEENVHYLSEKERRKAGRALERDIDEKVQFWVNCIQSCVPGAVILPVATYDDFFDTLPNGSEETKRRCEKLYDRLIQNEKSRINGIKERLRAMKSDHRANSCEAYRLRQLLSSYNRPKLIFGNRIDADCVMRVSGKDNRGIDNLRAKIINLATGAEMPPNATYPLFRGHLGSPIPTIRLRIREFVRETRENFHVISFEHFVHLLEAKMGISKVDNIGHIFDALQFLTSIGELSYFGECHTFENKNIKIENDVTVDDDQLHCSLLNFEEDVRTHESVVKVVGLSQFIFLNPKWLALAIGCILRHDLTEEINLTRELIRRKEESPWQYVGRGGSNFHAANKNVPIITLDDACMLWKAKKRIFRAAELAKYDASLSPYDFLINLLVHFNILVPIDLEMETATFGGHNYTSYNIGISIQDGGQDSSEKSLLLPIESNQPSFFLVPSLQGQIKPPASVWTYKCNEAWKICLCQSWYFPDNVPPGLMDRVSASVLRRIHTNSLPTSSGVPDYVSTFLRFRRIFSWRTALNLSLGKLAHGDDIDGPEIRIEIWVHLVDQDSDQCVAADVMSVGTRRLIVGAKGPEGSFCKNIWQGGFSLVVETISHIMSEYSGLEYQRQYVCPQCLACLNVNQAKVWNSKDILDAEMEGSGFIFCGFGHKNDIQTVEKTLSSPPDSKLNLMTDSPKSSTVVPFSKLLNAVVLIGLWDSDQKRLVKVGSGFVVDRKRGLIVTAAHVVVDMESGSKTFGSLHYGLNCPKVVIGIQIESENENRKKLVAPEACFRYIADIVATDVTNIDVCVLRISQRLKDFNCEGHLRSDQITEPASKIHFQEDKLQRLKLTSRCEYEEKVRILGYNQGGEGLTKTPKLNRTLEVMAGSVMKIHNARDILSETDLEENSFNPRVEIVVNCPTICGHSGGPCVNHLGEVIGILSRSDSVESHRCYLAPSKEIRNLVKSTILWEDKLHLGKLLR